MPTTPTLYLIDAFAQIFRAFFAIRTPMRSPTTGEPTHALFGVAGMLIKLRKELNPHYAAVAIDMPGPTFRDELYTEYKSTRERTPAELTAQIPRVFELFEGFGLPCIGQAALEADDVIATIVRRLLGDPACGDLAVRIVSKDKDLEQLIGDRVTLFDIHTDVTINAATLMESKGIRPDQVIDMLTLIGDTVDNVPGVPGIGPKIAAQLLQRYDTLDGIMCHLDEIKGKRREVLEASRDTLPLSKTLVTLRSDGTFPFSLESARVRPLDLRRLLRLFQELGFNRYQEEVRKLAAADEAPALVFEDSPAAIESTTPASSPEPVESAADDGSADYRAITTRADLEKVVAALHGARLIAVDTETTGLGRQADLCGISLSWEHGQGVYIPVRSLESSEHLDQESVLDILRSILEDTTRPKCGHNLKFDAEVLHRAGVRLRGIVSDTMLASVLLDPGRAGHKLDNLALAHLGYQMIPFSSLGIAEDRSIADVPLGEVTRYAAEDSDIALRLADLFAPQIEAAGMTTLLRDIEAPLVSVLAEMELNGIICDPEELGRQGAALAERVTALRAEINTLADMEMPLDSPSQLATALFTTLGFAAGKKTKTGYSTDITVLETLAAAADVSKPLTRIPGLIIEYRQLTKLISTYLGNLVASIDPHDGRIHTTFHQLAAATGRLNSQSPNLQNIPVRTDVGRLIRKAFVAPPEHLLICADYSQVELRLLAHLSRDQALVDAFDSGLDIHTAVAAQVFNVPMDQVSREQRNRAKTINFGIIYGVTPYGLSQRIDGLSVGEATQLIADYKARYPGIERFLGECVQQALDLGYVTTVEGRRRAVPEIASPNRHTRSLGERLAINSVVQGSAADLIKAAMVAVQRRIDSDNLPLRPLLQIHDELIFETPAEAAKDQAAIICAEMERALTLRIPLKAEAGIGKNWMEAK